MEQAIIRQAQAFFGKEANITIIGRLLGGMSNYTYIINVLDKLYTIRILGKNAHHFVDRTKEKYHLEQAEKLGLVPKTVYFNIETGVKIAEYIEGNILSETDYMPYLNKIVDVLKKVHHTTVDKKYDYELLKRLNNYEKINTGINPEYKILKTEWISLYQEKYNQFEKVFCHGDAQRTNLILKDDKIYLMDWEFSGWNDPYYDLACFGNMEFKDAILLLEAYIGKKANDEELKHLKFYRMYQALQWYLVALYKDSIGLSQELHIDFKLYANHYLDLAKTLYNEIK
ncbi:Choline/ethanolamine kinase [Alteracholeplasma palmae J233]|uniref:Choline/ethanolamine kinase n=1 Tax=Alteracholeplasma palmae (strain ATCC 49389 / J233) TaxID=1318466 RepID=U4KKU2_ALTPJ|nr:choline kinase family protein [Alteracholeplasma palmae]CCV64312.1 Choline/ethanolamine kinase [Alteracholeplasma palmae J233]